MSRLSFQSIIHASLTLAIQSCSDDSAGRTSSAIVPALTDSVLAQLTYPAPILRAGRVTLSKGEWEGDSVLGGRENAYLVRTAHGELSGDRQPSAVVILFSDPGATGRFFDIIPVFTVASGARAGRATELGDRIQPESLWVADGLVHLILVTHDSTDGLCCPTLREARDYRLVGDSLVLERSDLLAGPPAEAQAAATPFDLVATSRVANNVCYRSSRYTVVERDAKDVGSDLFVRTSRPGGCDADSLSGDYVWRNRDAEYFLGLRGDALFIDSGTGPDARDLIVIDLRTRRRIMESDYVDVAAGPDSLTIGIWRGFELAKPAAGCRPAPITGVDSLFWADLRTGAVRFAKKTRCATRQ